MRELTLLSLLLATTVHAEVFRWTDKDGVVHYADKPLAPEAKPASLPPLQTYQAGSPPPLIDTKPAAAAKPAIAISTPGDNDKLAANDGRLTIEVAANPASGQGVVYYLDGRPQNPTPTPSTALLLEKVAPGTHTLDAALVDATGHEVARAASVRIQVTPSQHR